MTAAENHDQDRGLLHDLRVMAAKRAERRRALKLLGAGGSVLLAGGSGLLLPHRAAAGNRCIADAVETAGPFPADGTNQSQGETSDVLTESGVVRKDIRRSFLSSTTKARGVNVTIRMTLVNTNAMCTRLPGFVIYIWHCDRDGGYSLYTVPKESYLRGVQVADEDGRLEFTTIFPGCYPGRYPHMHLEIFSSLDEATIGTNAVLTTQLAMPGDTCKEAYTARGYESARKNFADVSLSSDIVFWDDSKQQLKMMTPEFRGNPADGYKATVRVGIPV
ncbi:MAG: intradiol ring-cleavage dioxygenase [Alphaproteobacteria bacterium]